MSKVTFNDHLDDMMERLMNEDLTPAELELEVMRSKAVCQIAEKKIADRKVLADVMVGLSNGNIDKMFIPAEFSELKQISNNSKNT